MKKLCITLIIIFMAFIIINLLKMNSFSIALKMAGLNSYDIDEIEHSYGYTEGEFKVIKTSTKDEKIVLAIVEKNKLGFWTVTTKREDKAILPNLYSVAWLRRGGAKRYSFSENAMFETEWHMAYYGDNAIDLIQFHPGQLPHNVTVNIQQAGKIFWVHVITYDDAKTFNSIDIPSLLLENKCIPQE